MFSAVIVAALTAGSVIAAPIAERAQPSGWASGYLEDYETYHTRYLALSCETQHGTDFFESCCHPLLADESVSANRPSYCVANATQVSSAEAYEATAETVDGAASEFTNATSSIESVYESVVATATSSVADDSWTTDLASTTTIGAQALASDAAPTSTSTKEWVAPTTTSSTSTWVAPTTTSTTKAAATTTASSGSGQVESNAYATYFYQGGNAGACGNVHSDYDKIIAIDIAWYGNTGDVSQYCGKWITITNTNNGKSVTAQVADVCPTCDTNNSLDLSVGAFTAIATEDDGEVPITWQFV
ncbi:RlpA-like double-psi beta-barrel-protein domain-containing protein-containing protein [Naematelia encephala]|uniref:RlpA-like double-psi beta-barrel-protein domain-containing protein-containing protein n=1 Tax=Naematelia encephala TaxID=71784 RepID=A0A1Y2AJ35_9TREE|nr:RlpA-like double-psi beta-barrel-protein domain-containing protein-containing protein [Naematelia encephala]